MITYKQAKKIALELNDEINTCPLLSIQGSPFFDIAYHFFNKDDNSVGDKSIVILKETGEAINFTSFIIDYLPNKETKEIEF